MLTKKRINELRNEWPLYEGCPPHHHVIQVLLDKLDRLCTERGVFDDNLAAAILSLPDPEDY